MIKFPFGSTYLWFTEFLSVFYYIQKPTSLFRGMRIKFYYGKSSLPNKILLTETQLTWEVFLMLFFITGLSQRSSLQCLPRTFTTQKREKETIYTGIYSFAHSYLFTIFLLYFSNFLFDYQNSLHTTKIQQNRGWEKEGGRTWDHLNRDSYRLPLVAWMTGNSTLSTYGKKIPPDYLNTATIHNWLSEDKSSFITNNVPQGVPPVHMYATEGRPSSTPS